MCHIDDCESEVLLNFSDFFTNLAPEFCIKVRQGLVKKQNLRFQYQSSCNRNALLLAARQFRRQSVSVALKPNQIQPLDGAVLGFRFIKARKSQTVGHIFHHTHMRKQCVGLKHHGDVTISGRQQCHITVADENGSFGRHLQPGNHAQCSRLATARRAEQSHQFASFDLQVNIVDSNNILAVDLSDIVKNHWGCFGVNAHFRSLNIGTRLGHTPPDLCFPNHQLHGANNRQHHKNQRCRIGNCEAVIVIFHTPDDVTGRHVIFC